MDVYKVIDFFEWIPYGIAMMPIKMRVSFILALTALLGMFYGSFISPAIFNFFLIPRIEKKIGKKLEVHPLINCIFLGKWFCRQSEIAVYLINRYLALKFKNDCGLPKYCLRFGLRKAGYTIDMASKFEIIMSFLLIISMIITFFAVFAVWIINGQFSVFIK